MRVVADPVLFTARNGQDRLKVRAAVFRKSIGFFPETLKHLLLPDGFAFLDASVVGFLATGPRNGLKTFRHHKTADSTRGGERGIFAASEIRGGSAACGC